MPPEHDKQQTPDEHDTSVATGVIDRDQQSTATEVTNITTTANETIQQFQETLTDPATVQPEVTGENSRGEGNASTDATTTPPVSQADTSTTQAPEVVSDTSTTPTTDVASSTPVTPTVLSEEDQKAQEEFNLLRGSIFAEAVKKGKTLPAKKSTGERSSVGETILNSVGNLQEGIENHEASDEETSVFDLKKVAPILSTIMLGAILVKNFFSAYKEKGASKAFSENIPALLRFLAAGTSAVLGCLNESKTTKAIQNFIPPVKTICVIMETITAYAKNNNKKKAIEARFQDEDHKHLIDGLSYQNRTFWPKIVAASTQGLAELAYAIAFCSNAKASVLAGLKLAASSTGLIHNAISTTDNADMEKRGEAGPDEIHTRVADQHIEEFQQLYNDENYYIGFEASTPTDSDTPAWVTEDTTIDKKKSALAQYNKVSADFEALDVDTKLLDNCESQEEQEKAIRDAIGF